MSRYYYANTKDLSSPLSYRPVFLLNCDYELISKLFNNRMKRILKFSANNDQSGFLKDCLIGNNVKLLFDIAVMFSDF